MSEGVILWQCGVLHTNQTFRDFEYEGSKYRVYRKDYRIARPIHIVTKRKENGDYEYCTSYPFTSSHREAIEAYLGWGER